MTFGQDKKQKNEKKATNISLLGLKILILPRILHKQKIKRHTIRQTNIDMKYKMVKMCHLVNHNFSILQFSFKKIYMCAHAFFIPESATRSVVLRP